MPTGAYDTHNYVTMKKLILLLSVILCSLAASAQTALIATLSHDGEITTYSGSNALKDAYAAAVDGDKITLSAGTFNTPNFSKRVSIYGSGMTEGTGTMLTNSGNNISIDNAKPDDNTYITIESLIFNDNISAENVNYTIFLKCSFKRFSQQKITSKVKFIHSKILRLEDYSTLSLNDLILNNCVIIYLDLSHYASFYNCYVNTNSQYGSLRGYFNNCILSSRYKYEAIISGSVASYCYYIGEKSDFFSGISSQTNHVFVNLDPFKPDTYYELKDEYATEWLGSDGTQVGIYGGSLPFDPTPTTPQITKFNVSPKTTADGKLSVDIEVKAD